MFGLFRRSNSPSAKVKTEPLAERDIEDGLRKLCTLPGTAIGQEQGRFSDERFQMIANLLQNLDWKYGRKGYDCWRLRPRTYTILRNIGALSVMDSFSKFTDIHLPYSNRTLPQFVVDEGLRQSFLSFQRFVLTDARNLEVIGGSHIHFEGSGEKHFRTIASLGQGGFGAVDHVWSSLSLKRYARKRVNRGRDSEASRREQSYIVGELNSLKSLSHRHIVKIVGSYTDNEYIAFLMEPVADGDLLAFLTKSQRPSSQDCVCLRYFFGCLSGAVHYLHTKGIRHRDLTSRNILIKRGEVFISDFGTAYDWSRTQRSTTHDRNVPVNPDYMAPEVAKREPRSSPSDMWSLGVVFLEMTTVLLGRRLRDLRIHLVERSRSRGTDPCVWANLPATNEWMEILRQGNRGAEYDNEPITWVKALLQERPDYRPKSKDLMKDILESASFQKFCCFKCWPDFKDRAFEYDTEAVFNEDPLSYEDSGQVRERVAALFEPGHDAAPLDPAKTESIRKWIFSADVNTPLQPVRTPELPPSYDMCGGWPTTGSPTGSEISFFSSSETPDGSDIFSMTSNRDSLSDLPDDASDTTCKRITPSRTHSSSGYRDSGLGFYEYDSSSDDDDGNGSTDTLTYFREIEDSSGSDSGDTVVATVKPRELATSAIRPTSSEDLSVSSVLTSSLPNSIKDTVSALDALCEDEDLERPKFSPCHNQSPLPPDHRLSPIMSAIAPSASDDKPLPIGDKQKRDSHKTHLLKDANLSQEENTPKNQAEAGIRDNPTVPTDVEGWQNLSLVQLQRPQSQLEKRSDLDKSRRPSVSRARSVPCKQEAAHTSELGSQGLPAVQESQHIDEPKRLEDLEQAVETSKYPTKLVLREQESHQLTDLGPKDVSSLGKSRRRKDRKTLEEAKQETKTSVSPIAAVPQEHDAHELRDLQSQGPVKEGKRERSRSPKPSEESKQAIKASLAKSVLRKQRVRKLLDSTPNHSLEAEKRLSNESNLLEESTQDTKTSLSPTGLVSGKQQDSPLLELGSKDVPRVEKSQQSNKSKSSEEPKQETTTSLPGTKPVPRKDKAPQPLDSQSRGLPKAEKNEHNDSPKPVEKATQASHTTRHRNSKDPKHTDKTKPKLSFANVDHLNVEIQKPAPQKQRQPPIPGISPGAYIEDTWEAATSVATSAMSANTRKALAGVNLNRWWDRDYRLLEKFCAEGNVNAVRFLLDSKCNPGTKAKPRPGPIFKAVRGASLRHNKCFRALLAFDVDVDVQDKRTGKTALHFAIENPDFHGYSNLVRDVVAAGADTNKPDLNGDYPLMKIFYGSDSERLERYKVDALALLLHSEINGGTDVNIVVPGSLTTPLHSAVRRKDPYAVGMLLHKGADVNAKNAVGITPLLLIANQWRGILTAEQATVLKLLLDHPDIMVDVSGGSLERTALHHAAAVGASAAVEMLLERGAKAEKQDKEGSNALAIAAKHVEDMPLEEHIDTMTQLAVALGKSWPVGTSRCPVETACSQEDTALIEDLLESGLSPQHQNKKKGSLLHLAIRHGNLPVVKLLTKRGAFADAVNDKNEDSVAYARRQAEDHIADFLVRKGKYENENKKKRLDKSSKDGSESS